MLSGIYVVALAWLAIVPLDAARFHWSPAFPIWLKVVGEEQMLQAELKSYAEYERTVRYRLIPYVW